MSTTTTLLVALGAAFGAPARLLASRYLDADTPWGTLLVNLVGSTVLGWLVGHGVGANALSLWGTGFCGALTTYSAVSVQSVNRGALRGGVYAVGTVLSCLGVAWLGYLVGG